MVIFSCTNTPIHEERMEIGKISDFSNILNFKSIPDSTTDRSVFAFSDLGAWFGYGLPSVERPDLYGSFTGPFLMTQDNGVWMSPALSRLEIIDVETGKIIPLADATKKAINAYPGKLKQVFEIKNPELRIVSELIFATSRTALLRLSIENLAVDTNRKIQVRWRGDHFLKGGSFSKNDYGMQINFSKNENIGIISTNVEKHIEVNSENTAYEISIPPQLIEGKKTYHLALTHSFCFSTKEWKAEQTKLTKIFQIPDTVVAQNRERWENNLNKVLLNLKEEYSDISHQKIAVKCLLTLGCNWRSAAGFLKHDGLFPSYNYEWFNGFWSWDSWKHAVAIAQYDTDLAQHQIQAMYDFQDDKGMIADCVYRDTVIENHNWRDTKPPLSAWAVWEVFQKSKDENFLKELYPKIEKYHNWWYQYRDVDQNGLCEYGSTDGSLIAAKWESGMDNAVRFDDVKIIKNKDKGGVMNRESVDLNAYLYAEKVYMRSIALELGKNEKAQQYQTEADKLKQTIQELFYDEESGWFYDIDLVSKKTLKVFGAEGWIPLWAKIATKEQAAKVRETMLDPSKFATYIPFPTLAADHPKFEPNNGYWRGPIWLDQVYFAIQGLRKYGYEKEALQFSHHLFDRLEGLKNDDLPIRENYHPLTGKGMESKHFSWSAAHLLMLLSKN